MARLGELIEGGVIDLQALPVLANGIANGGPQMTMIGGKAKNRAYAKKEPKKQTVLTLVDRDSESHSFHVANVKAKPLRDAIVRTVDRKSHLVTDELTSYDPIGRETGNVRQLL
jgi:hypothetical protein